KPDPLPAPKPPEPAPVKPEEPKKPVEPPKRETVAEKAIATLEKVDGTVLRVAGTAKSAIKTGETLLPGQGLEASTAKSGATFAYADGTRVRLEGETIVLHLQSDGGKRFTVQQGGVAADVTPQPEGRPLTIFSSHAQAAVLGTTLRFAVSSTGTRVEVRQGKVQVTRKSDQKSVLVLADQAAEVLDSPNGNNEAWAKYSRKVETGTSAQITIAVKTGTRSPSGPTVGFDLLRLVPGGGDDYEAMPRWDSVFDAAWGGAATWTIEAGGQAGRFLQAARPGPGSSAKAKVFAVPSRATVDVSAFLKCPSGSTADYWMEFGYRLGSHSAQDFDVNGAAWTIIKKFDSSPDGEIEIKPLPTKK
ncbi:MAG TPA: FecR family protein, partial [Planctomycetota bacterium]|nr:FecR family protein [Planctomycetota bacterium]